MNFIVCAVFKNEAHILEEWIRHYLIRGCDHIYLVNDNSTDDFITVIGKFSNVTVYNNIVIGDKKAIYNEYFKQCLPLAKWVAFLDLSDFLYNADSKFLPDVFSKYSKFGQIIVPYYIFGSSGHYVQPTGAVHNFLKRGSSHGGRRCIMKGQRSLQKLTLDLDAKGHDSVRINNDDLLINNYCVQSLQWFLTVKAIRHSWDDITIQYFKERDQNTHIDNRLSLQTRLIEKASKSLLRFGPLIRT